MFDNKEDILNDLFGEIIEDKSDSNDEVASDNIDVATSGDAEEADASSAAKETSASDVAVEVNANDVAVEVSASDAVADDHASSQAGKSDSDNGNVLKENGRISNVDKIMDDVEFVMTREINPEDVEEELKKKNSKKVEKKNRQKAAEAAAREEVRPEERRAIRRQKRKHDRRVAIIGVVVVLVVLGIAGFFGKGFLDSYLENRVAVEPTPAVAEAIDEPEEVIEKPQIEFTPEIIEEPEEIVEQEVVEPEETPEELLDKMIDEMIAQMPLEDKVAGLFIISPEALTGQDKVTKAGDGTKEALEEFAVGGVIYDKSNISSPDQVKEMISNTSSYSRYPLFFAVDEEGGDIARVQAGLKLDKLPTAQELGNAGDAGEVYNTYNKIGTYLSEYGFNLDFAPVADVLTNPDNTSIGNRSFSSQSTVVANLIPEAVLGLQDAGVSACLKHWPGQGNADADTHEGLASTDKTQADMEQLEFEPFRTGIEAGVDVIMVGHIAAPEITGDNTPCSLSKDVVTGILREDLNYNGVIITDALDMSVISEYYGADEAAIKALKAGCDMLLMPEDFRLAYVGVIAAVENGTISEERINDCLKRVYRVKYADTLTE